MGKISKFTLLIYGNQEWKISLKGSVSQYLYAACKWNCIFDVIASKCSNKNTVWWCITQYYLLLCTCCMVSTYSQATRRDQNQCSLGSFGLVIKLRDCDIGLERDSSPVEREKMKGERTRPCTSNHRCRENRYAYKCSNYIWNWEMSWRVFNSDSDSK